MTYAVEVKDLVKRYKDVTAVDGVSFTVDQGEIFGLLGPNGAGKTTTIEMIEGLRKPDSGSITVQGINAIADSLKLKEIIGVQLQSTTLHDQIKVREILELFSTYYKKSVPINDLLEEVSLTEKQDAFIKTLSGGQKQRVALALALVNDPKVLFLDEPTTGLDPQARRNVWESISQLRDKGKTIMLTTHYMEEAETLCNRVGIIDHGKIIAMDTPAKLIKETGLESAVDFSCPPDQADSIIRKLKEVGRIVKKDDGRYTVFTAQPSAVLQDITKLANQNNILLSDLSIKKATLEDFFINLTGRNLRD